MEIMEEIKKLFKKSFNILYKNMDLKTTEKKCLT